MESKNLKSSVHSASFRDPSGFVFLKEGIPYRQINQSYRENYDHLMKSGLYAELIRLNLLIPHTEVSIDSIVPANYYKIIKPEVVPFVSYPYEWSFSRLKDAALRTLEIQKKALEFGMELKDASAFNIQRFQGHSVLIDTLSFQKHDANQPWVAYRQFCQHFLAPLALMSYCDMRLNKFFQVNIDGIPLDLASRLLPIKTYMHFGELIHIHLHSKAGLKSQAEIAEKRKSGYKLNLLALTDHLETTIKKLRPKKSKSAWNQYYESNNYSAEALKAKENFVEKCLDQIQPKIVWDLGANTGMFSRLANKRGIYTVAFDSDESAVDNNYLKSVENKELNLDALVMDITNPSPNLGWQGHERLSLMKRGPADMIFALAFIHHLAISNNIPLPQIASYFAQMSEWLVVEFVPKSDSQVKQLLESREDIFKDYTEEGFEKAFSPFFQIKEKISIPQSSRSIYLMQKK